jgi:two-component system NtrC family sensor kinase
MTGTLVHIPDVLAEREYELREGAARVGIRAVLSVREGQVVGTITLDRTEPVPFSDKQIAILKTFADQAVIAIENVRLSTELEARNRDLTATSEILRVISRSPTEVQPVFTAIAKSAAHLIGAVMASVYEFDGSLIHLRVVAPDDWPHADDLRRNFPTPPARNFAAGRVILDRAVLHRADLQNDPDTPELTQALAGRMRLRGVLWVPMLRDGEPVGVIGVAREESALFSDEQVRLLQTFADQAVIAIENVRLFAELQEKNRALTEAHARSPKLWSSRPPPARFCASSPARRQTCRPCSRRSCAARCACAAARSARSIATMGT